MKSSKIIDCPTEYRVFHKRTGLHSVLVYDHEPKSDAYRVANLRWETTSQGWMFHEDFYTLISSNGTNPKWEIRKFRLKSPKI